MAIERQRYGHSHRRARLESQRPILNVLAAQADAIPVYLRHHDARVRQDLRCSVSGSGGAYQEEAGALAVGRATASVAEFGVGHPGEA